MTLYDIYGILISADFVEDDVQLFEVRSSSTGKSYNIYCKDFCPVRKNDVIYGKTVRSGDEYLFIKCPAVMPSADESIVKDIMDISRPDKVYEYFNEGSSSSVVENISKCAEAYITYDTIPKDIPLKRKKCEKFLERWYYNFNLRRLYLLGLTKTEITKSQRIGWPGNSLSWEHNESELYHTLLKNPYIVIGISMERADEIVRRYGIDISNDIREAGIIARANYSKCTSHGWTSIPTNNVNDILEEVFKCEYRHDSIYLYHQAQVEDILVDGLSPNNGSSKDIIDMVLNNNVSIITGRAGTGKCLAPDTLVQAMNGIRRVDSLQIGDKLLGPDLEPREVLGVCNGIGQMYRIDIIIDSVMDYFICNGPHVLTFVEKEPYITGTNVIHYSKDTKLETAFSTLDKAIEFKNTLVRNLYDIPLNKLTSTDHLMARKSITGITGHSFFITPLGLGHYSGFELSGDGRFLLDNFIITHNTTAIKSIIKEIDSYYLSAFTGKAVNRLKNIDDAYTLHSLLYSKISEYKEYLIIDEASMVPNNLLAGVLRKLRFPKVVLIGDPNQLPPIQPGRLFTKLLDIVPKITLTKNYRSEGSIIQNINNLIDGNKIIWGDDFQFIKSENTDVIDSLVKDLSKHYSGMNVTVISPINMPLFEINMIMKNIYIGNTKSIEDVFGKIWNIGDRVMVTKNYPDVANGEEGIITKILGKSIVVDFGRIIIDILTIRSDNDTGKDIDKGNDKDEITTKDLTHSWALTVHKSQGSEWPVVIFYIPYDIGSFYNKNLMYTALSRAKEKLFIVAPSMNIFLKARYRKLPYRHDNLDKAIVS